jgi:hypothetical protein
MTNNTNRFLFAFAITTLVLLIAQWAWNNNGPAHMVTPYAYYLLGLFAVVTLVFHMAMLRSANGDPQAFIRSFMAGTTLKMFAYMGILVILFVSGIQGVRPFIVHFLVYYFIYTGLEIGLLYNSLKKVK